MALKNFVRELYEGASSRAHRFRYGLITFDIATIVFLVVSSFLPRTPLIGVIDVIIGIIILTDFLARFWISRDRLGDLMHPGNLADIVVIVSLLAPVAGEGLAFLRVVRVLRIMRSPLVLMRMRRDSRLFRENEQSVMAALNLGLFIFVTTGIVYESQRGLNEHITNYADALYFTVSTLTTTGFGDITLQGHWGRMLSVLIMIFGVSLFLRLIQILIRPHKVEHKCPDCGLKRHDADAVHCKHCGRVLHIEDEGAV
ncbi:potassium channel family protein [Aestuariivirga sp. YIM B02566]|uniref:Potassium channel family protein n=1 Tax=Taklimakanibacter albus TaxID=2800327 RepID=A0ACC5REV3_9HYPH|nr:potassium channel family protein [Aestuariivirga sp. YIM B02566]MBK1870938.1 potassium channel family protein [Aestuariivirga sp. YIM B02566]